MTNWVRHKSIMLKVQNIQTVEVHHGCNRIYIGMDGGHSKSLDLEDASQLDPLFDGICHMMKRESGCGEFHNWVSIFNSPIITTEELIRFSKENERTGEK